MILSIESSCDDSSIAVTRISDRKLLFHRKISQEIEHSKYGGVVPELAARLHVEALPKILEEAKKYFKDLKAVAVTNEPGLSVTLVEGITMGKAISISLDIPLIAINHLKGHIYSLFIEQEERLPMGVLLVSGGHTQILSVNSYRDIKVLASTLDDSFGESFDKVAKMMGLGYPGGPIIEKLAREGDENRFKFTVPLKNSPRLAFSCSGLKNQVRLKIESLKEMTEQDKKDISASFQKTITEHILQKTLKLFKRKKFKYFSIVGGASSNLYLREKIRDLCDDYGIELLLSDMEYCLDNAAMIGRASIEAYNLKEFVNISSISMNPRAAII